MRYSTKAIIIPVGLILVSLIFSCEKEKKTPPILTTYDVWSISQRSAWSGGEVTDDGGASIVARGVCWNSSTGPTINDKHTTENGDLGTFVSTLNGLAPATTYFVRAYATNKFVTGYGNEVSFESGPIQIAEIGTDQITSVNSTSAISGGIIYFNGGGVPVISKGICWSTTNSPTLENPHTSDGTGDEHFLSQLDGLSGNTTYYVRAYATNSAGTAYGNELNFKTLSDSAATVLFSPVLFNPTLTYGTVTDADWNVYKTIQIGTQTWMAENLKTTSYINASQIAHVTDNLFWPDYTLDAYCWYKNDIAWETKYGALYNWYAVTSGNLCPAGWHVPSSAEFTTLITFLGGENSSAGKLRESGTAHWESPNAGADNESGFSALPGGSLFTGEFVSFRTGSYWWSSTGINSDSASFMVLGNDYGSVSLTAGSKTNGMSVRCIKD
jgi:uncharacterized protein (TIGR02145 family)